MKSLWGEFLGTFILVFLGCGSVAWTILIEPLSLFQIASVWCVGVILGIWASHKWSDSHLNPAVTVGFLIYKDINFSDFIKYLSGQFLGAFTAAAALNYIFFNELFKARGLDTAMIFGEYYPNPGNASMKELSTIVAFSVEFVGAFFLMFGIFLIIRIRHKLNILIQPVLIGVLLLVLIFLLAPFTQAGFNPARDFAPRLFSYLNGWELAFEYNGWGWLFVYMIGPLAGATLAAIIAKKALTPRFQ